MRNNRGFDFSKFKKVAVDSDYATMKSSDGHEIRIAIKALSPRLKQELNDIPIAMVDGGDVPKPLEIDEIEEEVVPEETPTPEAPGPEIDISSEIQKYQDAGMISDPNATEQSQMQVEAIDVEPTPAGEDVATVAESAPQVQNPMTSADMRMAGIQAETDAQSQLGREQTAVLDKAVQAQQNLASRMEQNLKEFDAEDQKLFKELQNSKVDPNRYVGNMTTDKKISTAIGLMLGGFGSGLTGGENPALKFLNDQINRDIDAQKHEIGKKETLLGMNMKRFGNMKDALEATSIQMGKITALKTQAAVARSTDPLAKARGMQALGEMQAQIEERQRQLALRRAANSLMSGTGEPMDPEDAQGTINAIREQDPKMAEELQEKMVPGMGTASTKEDAKAVKELKAGVDGSKATIDDLIALSQKDFKSLSLEDRAKADTLAQSLIGQLRLPFLGPGTINQSERDILERIAANPTNVWSLDDVSRTRLKTLKGVLDKNLENSARAHGVNYSPIMKLSPQHRSFYKYAITHPNDPRSKAILEKLGMNGQGN